MTEALAPAPQLAAKAHRPYPGESEAYTKARTALIAEEVELRRHLERVAAQRRALPEAPIVTKDYRFEGKDGPATLADLFESHDTLVTYCYMFGPERERPCPMCTQFLGPLAANALDLRQKIGLAVIARSPVARLYDFAKERGWRGLPLYSDPTEAFGRDHNAWHDDGDWPSYDVFTKDKDGTIRHFWGSELGGTQDPGQDPRGAPEMSPLWNVLDTTPAGRGTDWYPSIDYD
ncbi:DUF899 domain-containing protein [Sphingomonas panacisoli]|uniref:DUF899 domain-containing protein n=1 Tax=Sphingomonas panacisoli TaxID=1813879 RepID=A0A5B8LEC0_9SPHN|nr:DUF899 family protein [Sphingomonas panacisoli]QDZ06115.1 DUF899 domain-containing protein [Sphingomonas panacisoli]